MGAGKPTCPRCRAGALALFGLGVAEWDGATWRPTGEWQRLWLRCVDCGHTWSTSRDRVTLERQLGGAV